MDRAKEFEQAKQAILNWYPYAQCGIYNVCNWCGDRVETVFLGEHFKVNICFDYEYFEVFGTNDAEWAELEKFYEGI